MTDPTYKGFINFINEQDSDKTINHLGGWNECSVGDYLSTVWGYPHRHNLEFIILCDSFAKDNIMNNNRELFFLLNMDATETVPTYGKLQEWLKKQ